MICLQHASLVTPSELIRDGTVLIEGKTIQEVGRHGEVYVPEDAEIIDCRGSLVAPGFVDLQINGAFGYDFTREPGTIWEVAARLPQFGVTSFLPTIVTSPLETIDRALEVMGNGAPIGFRGATPLGLHLEGPFLNPQKAGAHNRAHMRVPNIRDVEDWLPANGVRMVTMAPELSGALEVIEAFAARGVVVAAGHSNATLSEAKAAFDAGMRFATHLFNAMPALHHREPGLAGAVLADERVSTGLISDGIHVHPSLIKIVWQILNDGRLALISDGVAAMGMTSGNYVFADSTVYVSGDACRLNDGTLAGSVVPLDRMVRKLITYTGCSLPQAMRTVTSRPAIVAGVGQRKGQIARRYDADLVILDENLKVKKTMVQGVFVYEARLEAV